jgi:hypothetical protein
MEVDEVIEVGESVVSLNRLRGRGKVSGATVDDDVGVIFGCRGGKNRAHGLLRPG